jgi:hypothetical protein
MKAARASASARSAVTHDIEGKDLVGEKLVEE